MPRPKRWFHVSQDILDDSEFLTLCDKFGIAGVKFFLFIMAMLDKTDNHICFHPQVSIKNWAARIGSTRKQCLAIYQLLIDYRWISVGVTDDQSMFIYARNYMKYRGNRVHENEMTKQVSCSPPFLTLKERIRTEASPPFSSDVTLRVCSPNPKSPKTPSAKKQPNSQPSSTGDLNQAIQEGEALLVEEWGQEAAEKYLGRFDKVWEQWPRQIKLLPSKLAWIEARLTEEQAQLVWGHANRRDEGWRVYTPGLEKFLRERRWTDAIPPEMVHV